MKNYFDLKNRYVVITGAAGLMGQQHINAVCNNNGNPILIDINYKKLVTIKKKIYLKYKKKINIFKADISNEAQIKNIIKLIKKKKIKIGALINNAAADYKFDKKNNFNNSKLKLENFDIEIWKRDLNISLTGSLICTKFFGKEMAENNYGVILNIGSDLSIIAPDNRIYNNDKKMKYVKPVSYSVSKHGIVGLTKYTAVYWAKKNIRCNLIAPGGIFNNQPQSFINKIKKLIPLERLASENEYEATIAYMISEASSYVTGAVLTIDGGRTII